VPSELADPLGAVKVGKAGGVDEFGASRRRESFEALAERLLHLVEGLDETLVRVADGLLMPVDLCQSAHRRGASKTMAARNH
jgi:hypothetical protein